MDGELGMRGWVEGGGLVLKSRAAPPFLQTGLLCQPPVPKEGPRSVPRDVLAAGGRGRALAAAKGCWRESLRGAAAAAERWELQWRGILRICVSCC